MRRSRLFAVLVAVAAVAAAAVYQFDSDRITVDDMDLTPLTFVNLVVGAVAVGSLIRSDAWAAMQQSLAESCQ